MGKYLFKVWTKETGATSIDIDAICLLLTFGLVIAIVILSSSIMKVKFLICFQIHDS